MKYHPGGTLVNTIQQSSQLTEEKIKHIMTQLLLALDLMHRSNIIHRDLKPANILIMDKKEMQVCIADLGLAITTIDIKRLK